MDPLGADADVGRWYGQRGRGGGNRSWPRGL